jgi:hypothetical protein
MVLVRRPKYAAQSGITKPYVVRYWSAAAVSRGNNVQFVVDSIGGVSLEFLALTRESTAFLLSSVLAA